MRSARAAKPAPARHLFVVRTPAWAEVVDLQPRCARVLDPGRARDLELAQVAGIVEVIRDSLPEAYSWTIRERGPFLLALKILGRARA